MKNKKLHQTVSTVTHFFEQKNPTNDQFTRKRPNYSEDEDYFNQNQQQNNHIPQKNNWNKIDQPDNFYQQNIIEPFLNSEQTQQTQQHLCQRQSLAKSNIIMQSQNHINTHGYQPNPMQKEVPLPYYLQQHEIYTFCMDHLSYLLNHTWCSQ